LDTEDREARGNRDPADNVVRFPREWLGPREELVPFGPTTEPPVDRADPADSAANNAADFWGEDSANLQGVVESPTGELDDSTPGSPLGVMAASGTTIRRAVALLRTAVSVSPRRGLLIGAGFLALLLVIVGSVLGAGGSARPARAHRHAISAASISAGSFAGIEPRHIRLPRPRPADRVQTARVNKSHPLRSSAQNDASTGGPAQTDDVDVTHSTSGESPAGSNADETPAASSATTTPAASEAPYSTPQHSAPAPQPAQQSPSGALTCISNCG
jgi:hypothetical protein